MNTSIKILLGIVAAVWSTVAIGAPIPSGPIHTNKLRFRIPFHYDAQEMQRLEAKEIRLYLSRDKGRTWQQIQNVAPDSAKFNFQAQGDGEYWFAVRTVDGRGRLHPDAAVIEAGLQVIVDTTIPRLQLDLRQTVPGRIQLSWSASDENLDPTQLRLEYSQPGVDWQTLGVIPKASGQTEWAIPQGGNVSVRGSISDFARNTAHDQVQIRVNAADQAVPRPNTPDLRQPVASPGMTGPTNVALTLPDQFPGTNAPQAPEPAAVPADEGIQFAPMRSADVAISPAAPSGLKSTFISMKQSDGPVIAGEPRIGTENTAKQALTARHRVVNTHVFQIGYRLQDVGPSGVAGVEVYITQDQGATWFHYGTDEDNQSPAQVQVPRDGMYGFALGVRSGAGLTSDPPQAGDKPPIVVVVDQTPPQVQLLPLEQGRGRNTNKILIKWEYTDEYPSDKPISLYYSTTGQSPWQPITGPIDNTGSFIWTMGPGVPSRFYVRIEARDVAGNVQTAETPQPVLIDLSRPTAKIIDIETPGLISAPQ